LVKDKVDEEPVATTFANNDEEFANANDEELDAVANAFANNDDVLADAFAANAEELDTHIVPK
jgi:hypothetical protein